MTNPQPHNSPTAAFDLVTGAFGYTGRYIAQQLLTAGRRPIRALTGRPAHAITAAGPYHGQIQSLPFNFQHPDQLAENLRGAHTLYNTYWVRFNAGSVTFDQAIANSRLLFQAAQTAGIRRIVHISITNPDPQSPLPYFRGKALVEQALQETGISHAIIRPALVFGAGDILLNNIAWLLRRFPLFAVAGDGQYQAQPVYVDDLAALAVAAAPGTDNSIQDAVGPETYTFDQLVQLIANSIGRPARLLHLPPALTLALARLLGLALRDVILTKEEIAGLTANLLISAHPPQCPTRLSHWLTTNGNNLGAAYASELARHYRAR